MQFTNIVPRECFDESGLHRRRGQPGLWDWSPSEGELPEDLGAALAEVLSLFTDTTDQCCFAYWNGWGDPSVVMPPSRDDAERVEQERIDDSYRTGEVFRGTPREFREVASRFTIPGREYFLLEGPVSEVVTEWDGTGGGNLPSIWWPQDCAWCIAGDTDLDTTYVGASQACIDVLVASEDIEALETLLIASIGTDTRNPRN